MFLGQLFNAYVTVLFVDQLLIVLLTLISFSVLCYLCDMITKVPLCRCICGDIRETTGSAVCLCVTTTSCPLLLDTTWCDFHMRESKLERDWSDTTNMNY